MSEPVFFVDYLSELPDRDNRDVEDGIYDVSDIQFLELDDDTESGSDLGNAAKAFMLQYPDFVVAHAYETYTWFLLSEKPKPFTGKRIGSDLNYGSTNILTDCPRQLLILAEND